MQALFSNIETTSSQPTSQISQIERQRQKWRDELAALGARYVAQLPAKIVHIETLWCALERALDAAERLQDSPQPSDEISFFELYRSVHSLSGSGATYGFADVSIAAKELELLLLPISESSTQLPALSPACRAEIAGKLTRLKDAVQCSQIAK